MKEFTWYVAAPWIHKDAAYETVRKIREAGWSTCSRWAEPDNPDIAKEDPDRSIKLREQAVRDIEDVISADGLIYVNSAKSEGKATELGVSIALLKPIIIIGDRDRNIFLSLNIPAYPTIEDALKWLRGEGVFYIEWVGLQQGVYRHQLEDLDLEPSEADMAKLEFPSE